VQQSFFFLGPLKLHFYGIFIAIGFLLVYLYIRKFSSKYGLNFSDIEPVFFLSLFSSLVFARIYHVLSQVTYYAFSPVEIFYVWQGGLGIFGVIAGSMLAVFLYCQIKKKNPVKVMNLFFPPLLLAQAIGRLGNYFEFLSIPHPTFFYESILCFIAFFLYFYLTKKLRRYNFGLAYYLASYGAVRFFTEFLRVDTWQISKVHVAHVLSLIMFFGGIILLAAKLKKNILD